LYCSDVVKDLHHDILTKVQPLNIHIKMGEY
jgi:hypothetical protein